MYKILNNIRVLDLSRYISGPSCCRILADMGAEVIKVEKAGYGDEGRRCGPMKNGSSLYFSAYNRNKKSITIDFRSDRGKDVLRRLIEKSDMIVENFKAGTMAAMGLSYEEISKINPRAILVSITGFGQFGPDSRRPAYDQIISYRAHLYAKIGEDDFQLGPDLMSDTIMGMNAAMAAILALYERTVTGKGRWVDCCMLTSSVSSWPIGLADYAANGDHGEYVIDSPNGRYKAKDGKWMSIVAGSQPMFLRLREVIDDPVLRDEKYLDLKNRVHDNDIMCGAVGAWVKERASDEVDKTMSTAGIPCGKVCSWDEVLNDRQLAYREDIIQLPVKNCGTIPYAKFPAKFYGLEYIEDTQVPEFGEHNMEILSEILGMTPEEVEVYTK